MVLSSPLSTNTTPSDSSSAEGVLQSLYRAVSVPFSPGKGNLDATLIEEHLPLSSSETSGMVIPTMTATPTEGSMIDRLRSVQQSDKSVGLMNSSGGLGGEVSDPATFASLVAGCDSFDDHVLMEDQNNQEYNAFVDTSSIAPNLPSQNHTELTSNSMTLRHRLTLRAPSRLRSSTLVPQVERRVKISGSFDVITLLLVKDIGVTICGGVIGASGSHACVDTVIPGKISCAIKSHNVKAKGLLEHHVFIRTPSLRDKHTVYITPCLDVTTLASEILIPLLAIERTVEVWSSLFPRFPSLHSSDASELVAAVDMAVEGKYSFQTPSKKQCATGKIS